MKLFWKIIIPLFLLVIIAAAVVIYENVDRQTELIYDNNQHMLENNYIILTSFIRKQEEKLIALATQTANIKKVQQAYAGKKREVLFKLQNPGYQKLKQQGIVSGQGFFSPPAKTFLRLHSPKKYDDDVSAFRLMAVALNAQKKPMFGIEPGKYGLAIRGGVPVSSAGTQLGEVEYMRFIDESVLQQVRELIHGELSIYVPVETKAVMTKAKLTENAPAGLLSYSTTVEKLLPIDSLVYKQVLQSGKKFTIQVSDQAHSFDVLIAPLLDYKGDVAAVLEIRLLRDPLLAEIVQTRNVGIMFGLIVLLIGALIIWLIVQRSISKPIVQLRRFATDISLGNLDVSIAVNSKDEINALAESFERMRVSLKGAIKRLQEKKKKA